MENGIVTLVSLVLGLALWASLGAVLSLVLVAGAADRESADVAGGEDLALRRGAHPVAADLAHLPAHEPPRLLHRKQISDTPPCPEIHPRNASKRDPARRRTHHGIGVAVHGAAQSADLPAEV
jgi:hypothetical protein